jgi:hypothetical protein
MNSRFLVASAMVLSALTFSSTSEARILSKAVIDSGRVGNGGFAYVCRDDAGAITLARLLDLWEAEKVPTWANNQSVDDQITAALERLKRYSPNSWVAVTENLDSFRKFAQFSKRALNPTEDAFPSYKPGKGCGYEQVARYEPVISETGRSGLRIASEIYDSPHFSNSDRAALFVHEAAYFRDREVNDAKNSQLTRMVVAHLFSDSLIPNAVRLATAALLTGEKTWDDVFNPKKKIASTILAVPTPEKIAFRVYFSAVDGIDAYTIGSMTSAQRVAKYRCRSNTSDTTGKITENDTGWMKLAELVKTSPLPYDPETEAVGIKSEMAASEFLSSETMDMGGFMTNSILLRCERKDAKGRVKSVAFADAVFVFPEADSLYIMEDRSLRVSGGTTPMTPISSTYDPERVKNGEDAHQVTYYPEIVRGIF